MRQIILIVITFLGNLMYINAGEGPAQETPSLSWTAQQKRAWIYERLVAPVQNAQLAQAYTEKLAAMSNQQLDDTIASYQRQLAYKQKLIEQQRREVLARQQYARNSGFRPIVTWLPTGTNFTANAVVSPDRRYVRMSLSPFFSTIPRVDTFNYVTGQSRNIYRATPSTYGTRAPSRSPQVRPGHSWYKKIRTLR